MGHRLPQAVGSERPLGWPHGRELRALGPLTLAALPLPSSPRSPESFSPYLKCSLKEKAGELFTGT